MLTVNIWGGCIVAQYQSGGLDLFRSSIICKAEKQRFFFYHVLCYRIIVVPDWFVIYAKLISIYSENDI